ncbi:MAG: hypothetical protein K9N62_07235 [Verrucomicrobia bacterium]|nr:hypothetical protein [Verrucomicrobiota bacterium]
MQAQIAALTQESAALRKKQLQTMEWKAIWGKPAIFAGAVMILFVAVFTDNRRKTAAA